MNWTVWLTVGSTTLFVSVVICWLALITVMVLSADRYWRK